MREIITSEEAFARIKARWPNVKMASELLPVPPPEQVKVKKPTKRKPKA